MIDEIINVWKNLSLNKVNYLTIGGFAVNIYGYGRNTGDIDIFIEDTAINRENLRKAIKQMGLGDFESITTMSFVPGWTDFTLNFKFRLDIMTSVKGLEDKSFNELLERANIIEIEGLPVYFIDYENLIIAKKASNRPKDILDVEELEKLNNPDLI
jgi:predicted nucleotidyltransferase